MFSCCTQGGALATALFVTLTLLLYGGLCDQDVACHVMMGDITVVLPFVFVVRWVGTPQKLRGLS